MGVLGASGGTYAHNLGVLALDGEMEGRLEVHVLEVHVGFAVEDELLGHFDVVVEGGEVQGRVAVVFFFVDDPGSGEFGQEDFHGAREKKEECYI